MNYFNDLLLILDSTVRLAVPLILACLAGLYSERAGIVDIGLEGKLLGSAFGAAAVAAVTGSPWLGLLAGIGVALAMSGIHGLASINLKGNQTISGVALNFLAAGLTTFLGQSWFHRGGMTPQLSNDQRFNPIVLPFAPELAGVPILGPIYSELISGHNILAYAAFVAVPITAFVLFQTRFGLRLRAVGENPKALDTAGI
ncbi:MAG: Nucleoside transporter rane protein, partial [Devosia sp.]|nr:Nucleoside transporter rane protein [Devosia sp.]